MRRGRLIGVGLGPGDPGWLTVAALERLGRAEEIYVAGAGGYSQLASSLVRHHLGSARRLRVLAFPTAGGDAAATWDAHAEQVAARLAAGGDVVMAVEGDPALYSSFTRLAQAVRRRYPGAAIEMVPGVSSLTAAAAVTGRELASGDEGIAVLTARSHPDRLRLALRAFETVVVLKAGSALPCVRRLLEEAGRLEEAVLVERCGWPDQRVLPLAEIPPGAQAGYFSLVLVRSGGPATAGKGEGQ